MRTFTSQKTISSVKRLTYSGSPSKGTQSVVYTNLSGYLRPMSEEAAAVSGMQWGFAFNLITEIDSPLLIGDVITIAGQDYTVRGMVSHDRGGRTAYNKYTLTKAQA